MPDLSIQYEAGTQGTLRFVCEETLYDTDGNIVTPPFEVLATLDGGSPSVDTVTLRSGVDPDVSPNPWAYKVFENITGQNERVLFLIMPLTNSDFVDVVQVDQPDAPELFVLKSVFDAHVDDPGGGATQQDIDDAIDAHEAEANPHPTYLTQAEADVLYETFGAVAAHELELDPHPGYTTTAEATTIADARAAAAVATHEGAANPHPVYLTQAEADALYPDQSHADTHADGGSDEVTIAEGQVTGLTAALAAKAPLASPLFTGDPRGPTPAAGDNDTSFATTQWVQTELNDYALLADPAFTGNPTAPTQSAGNNSTRLATTAFVMTAVGLYVPKSLFTGKGVIAVATAADTPAAHGAPSTGQFLVGDTSQADGWINRVLARSDLPSLPKCSIADSAATISNGTGGTTVGTTATESVDTDGFHSNVTNPERMTVPSGLDGPYRVAARGTWASNATGQRRLSYMVNGGTAVTMYLIPPVNGAVTALAISVPIPANLVAGDYVTLEVAQTSGGNLSFTLTEFTLLREAGN